MVVKKSLLERNSWRKESWLLLRLAFPAAAGVFVFRLMGVTTVLFAGHMGPAALAATGLAFATANLSGYSIIIGLAGALQTIVGQAVGAENYKLVGLSLQRCLLLLWFFCLPVSALWLLSKPLLLSSGMDRDLAVGTAGFLRILVAGLWFNSVTAAVLEWMRSQSYVVTPSLCIAFVAITHIPMTYFFVITLGLGLWGGAISIVISHFLELILSMMCIYLSGVYKKSCVPWSKESFRNLRPVVQLAVPSLFMMIEWWASEALVLMAAHLDAPDLAVSTMTIFQTMNAVSTMIPFGLSVASGTRVSNELGSGNYKCAHHASQVAVLWGFLLTSLVGGAILSSSHQLGHAFHASPDVMKATLHTMLVLAPKAVLDGIHMSISGIIRGSGKQAAAAPIMIISYCGIGLPGAYWLSFIKNKGVIGLCMGYFLGVLVHTLAYVTIWLTMNWKEQAIQALSRVNEQGHQDWVAQPKLPAVNLYMSNSEKMFQKAEKALNKTTSRTESGFTKNSLHRMYTIDLGTPRRPGHQYQLRDRDELHSPGTSLSAGKAGCLPQQEIPTCSESKSPGLPKLDQSCEIKNIAKLETASPIKASRANRTRACFQNIRQITEPLVIMIALIAGWAMSLVNKPMSLRPPLHPLDQK